MSHSLHHTDAADTAKLLQELDCSGDVSLELLRRDPRVSFEMDCRGELQSADHACGYGYYYASVIGSGTAELIEGAEKLDALSALMRHMAGREDTFTEDQARGVAVLAIRVRSLSAKAKKH